MPSEIADTIVIGAGVTGLAIARQLALAGREVLVLESNSSGTRPSDYVLGQRDYTTLGRP